MRMKQRVRRNKKREKKPTLSTSLSSCLVGASSGDVKDRISLLLTRLSFCA